jgi:hypothetical protein
MADHRSSPHPSDDEAEGVDATNSPCPPQPPLPVESAFSTRGSRGRERRDNFAPYAEDIYLGSAGASNTRSTAAVAPAMDFATGLPTDLDEIASPLSDHIQDEQLQKSLSDLMTIQDGSSKQLDQARGASFKAGQNIFASAASSPGISRNNKPSAAPAMVSCETRRGFYYSIILFVFIILLFFLFYTSAAAAASSSSSLPLRSTRRRSDRTARRTPSRPCARTSKARSRRAP